MPNQYDARRRKIERDRQLAAAIRASGNEPLPPSRQTGGRFDAPVSGWEHANKAVQQLLAGWQDRQSNKAEQQLEAEQAKAQAEWIRGLTEAQTPDEVQPIVSTGSLIGDPTQEQMTNRLSAVNTFDEATKASEAVDRNKLLAHYMKGGDVGGIPAALGAAGLERELLPPVSEPFTLGADDTRFSSRGKVIARGTPKVDNVRTDTDDIREYQKAVEGGYEGSFTDYMLMMKKAGAASQTVNLPPQLKAEAQTVGQGFGEAYNAIQASGVAAESKINRYDRMGGLLEGVNTGRLAPSIKEIAAVGESLGLKVDDTLGAKQALEALSSEVALTLRNPSGGAGMPGALSDKDREFLVSMVPGLVKTPEGNRLIIETAKKLAQRDKEVAQLARDYRIRVGEMNEGFYNELRAFSEANPLFEAPVAEATEGAFSDEAKEKRFQEWLKANP